jgi:hypothetical protein
MRGRAETKEMKRAMIEKVLAAWEKAPQLRLGQLIVNATSKPDGRFDRDDTYEQRLFYVEDAVLVETIEKAVSDG